LQFDKFVEARNGLESALTEMERAALDLRRVSREHGVCVTNKAAGVDGRYVHLFVMSQAYDKMDDVAEN
jgi:hypothetical protein